MQCWRMVRALRSHGRCLLVVSSDEISSYASRSRTSSVTGRRLILTCQPRRPIRKIFASSVERTYTSVESLTTKTVGPLKQPSSSTIASLHDITGSFASCYKSHRLPTCLRPLHYVVLLHDFSVSFKVLPLLSRISLLAVVPWRHHLVMILWLSSQQKRFCEASKRVRPLMGASDLRRIYNNIFNALCQPPITFT